MSDVPLDADGQRVFVRQTADALGLSVSRLAIEAGLSESTLNAFVTGARKHTLSARSLRAVVEAAERLGRTPANGDAPASPADGLRAAIRSFMAARGMTVSGWCRHAGRPESTLRNFLSGQSDTMTYETFAALAGAAGATVAQITGEAPTSGATQLGNGSPPGARLILEIRQEVTPDQAKRIFEILNEGR